MIKVYIANVIPSGDVMPFFSEYRKKKLIKIKNTRHLFQSATAERLLCYAAKREGVSLPLNIKTEKSGKPFADNLFFNISHSGEKVLVAVSDEVVGADLQKINPNQNLNVAQKILVENERENLNIDSFYRLFTMKESYFKMTGEGLPLSPVAFENFEKCFFETFRNGEYYVSICSGNPFEFTVINVSPESLY